MSLNPLWEEVTPQCASSRLKGTLSQCYPSPTVWVAQGTAVVDLLCVEPSPIAPDVPYRKDQDAYTGRWRGRFGRDPNSSVTDVTRNDRLKGNVSVTYVTLVPWRRERRCHVPSPQSLYHSWAARSPNAVHLLQLNTLNKNINATLLFLPPFFMSWTQRSKTFSMYTKGLFLSNIVHKSV